MKKDEIPAEISQKEGYVEIQFPEDMPTEAIEKQVGECIDETCECCTPAFREKVEDFEYSEDTASKVKIYGTITKEEVMENVASCAPKIKK